MPTSILVGVIGPAILLAIAKDARRQRGGGVSIRLDENIITALTVRTVPETLRAQGRVAIIEMIRLETDGYLEGVSSQRRAREGSHQPPFLQHYSDP